MTDAEISRAVALAIGYAPESVRIAPSTYCAVYRNCYGHERWEEFDYRDPTVCLPLIEWLMREHEVTLQRCLDNKRFGVFKQGFGWYWADTLAEAVARAVIAVRKGE